MVESAAAASDVALSPLLTPKTRLPTTSTDPEKNVCKTNRRPHGPSQSSGLNFNRLVSRRRDGKMEAGSQKEGADERRKDRRMEEKRREG